MVDYGGTNSPPQSYIQHGLGVAALAGGKTRGIARKASIVYAQIQFDNAQPLEKNLEALIKVATDAATKAKNTCIVNMSWGVGQNTPVSKVYFDIMSKKRSPHSPLIPRSS